jgi:hypothetical protein
MSTIFISFFPKHASVETEAEHDELIVTYRDWLDIHGCYGKLYMMNQGKATVLCRFREPNDIIINGLNVYVSEIAVLFRLIFEI